MRPTRRYIRPVSHSRPKRYTNWFLREWMATLHVSQKDIIEKTELSKGVVSLLVNDRQDYSPTIVRDVAHALNIAVYELFMDPQDAMSLRQLRKDAIQVVRTQERLEGLSPVKPANDRTGTDG